MRMDYVVKTTYHVEIIIAQYMMTSSNGNFFALLALCEGNSPVTGEFLSQRPVTRSFDIFFDLSPNNRDVRNLRRHRTHCDVTVMKWRCIIWGRSHVCAPWIHLETRDNSCTPSKRLPSVIRTETHFTAIEYYNLVVSRDHQAVWTEFVELTKIWPGQFTIASESRASRKLDFRYKHWGRVTNICISKLTIIGSDNGLAPSIYLGISRFNITRYCTHSKIKLRSDEEIA